MLTNLHHGSADPLFSGPGKGTIRPWERQRFRPFRRPPARASSPPDVNGHSLTNSELTLDGSMVQALEADTPPDVALGLTRLAMTGGTLMVN